VVTVGGMCMLAQHRGGARFCPRDGVLQFSVRYKVVVVCKNRDTIAGWHVPPLLICRGGCKVFAAQKPIAYTALLATEFIHIVQILDNLNYHKILGLNMFGI